MKYGEDGLDPTKTVKVDGKQEACDVSRLINKLNVEAEIEMEKQKKKNKKKNKK